MPVFTQTCPADPVVLVDEGMLALAATATCTCGSLPLPASTSSDGEGDSIMESVDYDHNYDSMDNSNGGASGAHASSSLFIHIDGVRHWTTCALSLASSNSTSFNLNTLTPAQQSILLLKQQQQQLIAGLALLRKKRQPSVSGVGEGTARNGGLGLGPYGQQLQREKKDPFDAVRLRPSRIGHLYTGSRFQGRQKSGSNSYEVMVDIKVKRN
jgi:hypothetical protein